MNLALVLLLVVAATPVPRPVARAVAAPVTAHYFGLWRGEHLLVHPGGEPAFDPARLPRGAVGPMVRLVEARTWIARVVAAAAPVSVNGLAIGTRLTLFDIHGERCEGTVTGWVLAAPHAADPASAAARPDATLFAEVAGCSAPFSVWDEERRVWGVAGEHAPAEVPTLASSMPDSLPLVMKRFAHQQGFMVIPGSASLWSLPDGSFVATMDLGVAYEDPDAVAAVLHMTLTSGGWRVRRLLPFLPGGGKLLGVPDLDGDGAPELVRAEADGSVRLWASAPERGGYYRGVTVARLLRTSVSD